MHDNNLVESPIDRDVMTKHVCMKRLIKVDEARMVSATIYMNTTPVGHGILALSTSPLVAVKMGIT